MYFGVCKMKSTKILFHGNYKYAHFLMISFGTVIKTSVSDITWQQATIPLRPRSLGICQASDMCYAAYLGSCSASKDLVCRLLGLDFDTGFMLVGEVLAQQSFS